MIKQSINWMKDNWATAYTYATAPIRLIVILLYTPYIVYGLYKYYKDKK